MIQWLKNKNTNRLARRRERKRSKSPFMLLQAGEPMLICLTDGNRVHRSEIASTRLAKSLAGSVKVGAGVMIYYIDPEMVEIGEGTELRDFSILEVGGRLEIGADCVIGAYNWFQSSGSITLGKGVITGPHCSIISTSHEQPSVHSSVHKSVLSKGTVTIGENSWIGAGVSILQGVKVGQNVTIGAGIVFTKDIPSNSVAFGSPCRVREKA